MSAPAAGRHVRERIALDNVTLIGVDGVDIDRLVVAADVCRKFLRFKAVRLLSHLPHDSPDVVRIEPVTSKEAYSAFVIRQLHRYVETSHALVIQWDGFVLNPSAWTNLFLHYDYIGAPWHHRRADRNIGNGGFSLRSRCLLEAIATDPEIDVYHPEDDVICRLHGARLESRGFTFAPETLASRFSVELGTWCDQFGFHEADISTWPIEQFLDPGRHVRYIEQFHRLFPRARARAGAGEPRPAVTEGNDDRR